MTNLPSFRSLLAAAALLAAAGACTKKSETRQEADRAAEVVNERVEDLKEESRDLTETAKDNADDIHANGRAHGNANGTAHGNAVDEVRVPPRVADQGTGDMVDRDVVGDRDVPGNSAPMTGQPMDRKSDHDPDTVRGTTEYFDRKGGDSIADDAKDVGKTARQLEDANNEFKYRKMVRVGTLRAVHAVAASQPMLINAFVEGFPLVEKDRAEVQEKLVIFQMRLDEAGNAIQSLELVEANDWETRNDAASKAIERVESSRDDAWEALDEADAINDRTSMR